MKHLKSLIYITMILSLSHARADSINELSDQQKNAILGVHLCENKVINSMARKKCKSFALRSPGINHETVKACVSLPMSVAGNSRHGRLDMLAGDCVRFASWKGYDEHFVSECAAEARLRYESGQNGRNLYDSIKNCLFSYR